MYIVFVRVGTCTNNVIMRTVKRVIFNIIIITPILHHYGKCKINGFTCNNYVKLLPTNLALKY